MSEAHNRPVSASTQDGTFLGPIEPPTHWMDSEEYQIDLASSAPQRPPSEEPEGAAVDGMRPGNTHTANSKSYHHPGIETGGLDALEVTIYATLTEKREALCRQLAEQRLLSQEERGKGVIKVLGATFEVSPRGFRWGNVSMEYVLESDGIQIALAKLGTDKNLAQAKVEIRSFRLMRDGHRAAWKAAVALLNELGMVYNEGKISRADICVDLPDVDVKQFMDAFYEKRIVTRANDLTPKYSGPAGEVPTGLSGGNRQTIAIRIYDKKYHLRKVERESQAKLKCEILHHRRWGGKIPRKATRIEYQIRRKWLQGLFTNCLTVEGFFECLPAIQEYLTTKYFRIVDDAGYRKSQNITKAKTSELWSYVQWCFATMAEGEFVELKRKEVAPMHAPNALKRFRSAMKGVLMYYPGDFEDLEQVMQFLTNISYQELSRSQVDYEKMVKEIQAKRVQQSVRGVTGLTEFEETISREKAYRLHLFYDHTFEETPF